ncbi:MAG: dienelactone hydrolase family protein [Chloroflexi bacterium]|nr:dienelactone hydrolase family protein [Chloroflexota bacterium]MDA1147642.1 dienelactone hydrolase family protein [Chloroflexota bacterium]
MCFPYDAVPPITPIAGAAIDTEDVTLTAADGTEFAAFVARAEASRGPAVVVMPDVRGLFPFYEELAMRFAERGYDAVAMDYFGRTAGVGKRDADFPFREHIPQTTFDGVKSDVAACVAYLRSAPGNGARKVFTIGFCYGGSGSWAQAANGHGLSGAIGFYGHPTRENMPPGSAAIIDLVPQFECPILGLMGGADQGIPREEVDKFEAALQAAGKPHELDSYAGAPHSFFDRGFEEYATESDDAWTRVLGFIEKYSTAPVGA